MKTISDLKQLAKENQIEIPWRLRKKSEIVEFLKNSGLEIPEVDLLSRERLRQMARERGIPTSLSLSELREGLRGEAPQERSSLRRPIIAVRRKNKKPPVPTPRRKKQPIMNESVPLIDAEISVPQQVPLKPPRTKKISKTCKLNS